MNRFFFVFLLIILLSQASCTKDDYEGVGRSVVLTGTVTNTETGKPIPNVVISDGYFTTLTTENGVYFLKNHPNARHIFYSIPEEYEVPLKQGSPYFYSEIDSRYDTCVVDFKLTPLKNGIENEFTLFCVTDTHISSTRSENRFNNETIEDIKEEIKKYPISYGITMGDLTSNTPEYNPAIKKSFYSTKIPFFHTIGNHDFLKSKSKTIDAAVRYESDFGPINYSFNRGKVHFIVMNDILYYGNDIYKGGFTNEQLNWLRSDLNCISKDKLLIICVHIPILDNDNFEKRKDFIDIIKDFKEVHIMSGHNHRVKNIIYNKGIKIYEHITGAAGGLWWSNTVNYCGAPNGYAVYNIKDNTITNWYYKSTRFDSDYQARMYHPNTFGDTKGYVVANVWNADPTWKIELYENGVNNGVNKGPMEQFTDYDPGIFQLLKSQNTPESSNLYKKTEHLYRLKTSNMTNQFSIKITDRFGNIYYQSNVMLNADQLKSY
jgi:hypothetical protein